MKRIGIWKNRFILLGMIAMMLLFISGCSGDDLTPVSGNDPTTPWLVTATEDTWLTTNPFESKHDGGWVYSAREDVIYAMYGEDAGDNGLTLYRIDHIAHTSTIATTWLFGRHGSQPVIDDDGTYIYQPPSESTNQLERYNTITKERETLAPAPMESTYSHGAWKNGKLWIVLDDDNLYSYDPATDAWSASLHDFGAYGNVASSGPTSDLIYVLLTDATFYSYDVTNGTVVPLTPDPNGFDLGGNNELTWFGASIGFIYAAENYDGDPAIYDIANDTWQTLSDPKAPNSWAGHATYDTSRMRLYVTGVDDSVWYYQY